MYTTESEVAEVVGELIERKRSDAARQSALRQAQKYLARRDPDVWQDRLLGAENARRHEVKRVIADMIRKSLELRDKCTDAAGRDRFNAEAMRLATIERSF